jgi:hypothetical protein
MIFSEFVRLSIGVLILGLTLTGAEAAERNVYFTGDFESGQVQPARESYDGFYIATLPNPQAGTKSAKGTSGGFGPSTSHDTRVVDREVVGGQTVSPRRGDFFIRSSLYKNKSYVELNGGALDKPRSMIYLTNSLHRIDHDVEGYVGFSVYTPLNYEHETGTRTASGSVQLFALIDTPSRQFAALNQYVKNPYTEAHWWLLYWTDDKSVTGTDESKTVVDLGPVAPDLGKWTDFVIRFRSNPFSVATNPASKGIANSKNRTFAGNMGILQVWKAEGPVNPSGNRNMVRKFSKVNTPVGLVPHATGKLAHTWRIYKYGWKKNRTSVEGPIWFGFDEIRTGLVGRDGTTYADVNPSGASCSSDCEGLSDALAHKPLAPELAIEQ